MLFYKFKSAQDSLYALDIAIHERLYCADYGELNDPFEGQFRARIDPSNRGLFGRRPGPDTSRIIYSDVVSSGLSGPSKVCSLSSDWQDVRMWALYAESFRGMAFEFDIAADAPELHRVRYTEELPKLNIGLLLPSDTVEALTHKTYHWRYECEWRFISDRRYVELPGQLTRILLGSRVTTTVKEAVLKIAPQHTVVQMVTLNPEGVQMAEGVRLPRP